MSDTTKSIVPFDGSKYSIWKSRIRALIDETILEEDALTILDCDIRPLNVSNSDWMKRNKIAKGIIIRNLNDSIVNCATSDPKLTAREIFLKLDSLYMRVSIATELAMEMKLVNLKYDENVPLSQHFMHFDEMIADLEAASGDKLKETNKIARLLSTLPKSYYPLVIAIQTLSNDKLSLAFVKIRLLDHEVQLKTDVSETSAKILMAEVNNDTNKKFTAKFKNNNRVNSKNNRPNFKKTFNKNFNKNKNRKYNNNHNNAVNKNKNVKKCEHCGRINHEKSNCYYYHKMCQNNTQQSYVAYDQQYNHFAFMLINNKIITNRNNLNKVSFILDSGATDHLVNDLSLFENVIDLQEPIIINIAKINETIKAEKKGTIKVISKDGFNGALKDVLYVPEIPFNLISVKRMQDNGLRVIFHESGQVFIQQNGKTIIKGEKDKHLKIISFIVKRNLCNQIVTNKQISKYKLWHERLGHIHRDKFLKLKENNFIEDEEVLKSIDVSNDICESCISGKQARLPFNKNRDRSHINRPLYIIHSDVCGPIKPATIDDKNYFVTFIDEYTHYTIVYLLGHKSEVFKVFQDFINKSEAFFNLKIAYLYCDNGTEYLSNQFKELCAKKGIQYHLTVPHTPQQNSIAERMNRTLVEKARTMIHSAELQKTFWGEAVLTAVYLLNISPTKALQGNKTPFELWHRRKPSISRLRVFGSTVYMLIKTQRDKFDEKSKKGIFVGYLNNGYKVLDTTTNKFVVTRDVIFDEVNFKTSRPSIYKNENNENGKLEVINKNSFGQQTDKPYEISMHDSKNGQENSLKRKRTDTNEDHEIEIDKSVTDEVNKNILSENIGSQNDHNVNRHRRSARLLNKPIVSYNEDDQYYNLSAQCIVYDIPKSYNEIKNRTDSKEWEKAIRDELDSLLKNKTWDIVPIPVNKNIVGCRWVFMLKKNGNNDVVKYKARLVAKGYSQEYMVDYFDTFAPVARITTFRLMLSFAHQHDLLIHQMDVKTAFLNGKLNEEIYMKIPEGINANSNHVCKLNKSLYGLKQSARCWFQHFDQVIRKYGFVSSSVDRCLYFLQNSNVKNNIYLLLYVDDILICTYYESTMVKIKKYLTDNFAMVDMNEVKTFLGINIERGDGILTLDQNDYLRSVLKRFKMTDCNSINTPLPTKLNYENLNSDIHYEAPCRELIGSLMYAMLCTRPDLCIPLNLLSRYQNKNNQELWQSLKRVLRYIKGTLTLKLIYRKNSSADILVGYVDADWASNETDRKSTTGYVFKMFNNTVSWNSKRQTTVATSSTEAEYMALYEGVKETCWLKSVLDSINIKISKPITIFEDNNSCIAIAKNPTDHKRSKHIDVKYHFSREKVEQKLINIKYISTGFQLADMFTKPLPAPMFTKMRDDIGLQEYEKP